MKEPVQKPKVAVFSQNQSLIEACQSILEKHDATCDVFFNFLEIEDSRLKDYQLIIADVEHPDESGVHWLEKLRRFPVLKNLPVMVMSAFMTDEQGEALRKAYPESSQILIRVPIAENSFESLVGYYLKRGIDISIPLPKGADDAAKPGVFDVPPMDQVENSSLSELYERQKSKEEKDEVEERTRDVITLDEHQKQKSIYEEKDIDALHRYIELREKDLARLADALNRTHEKLNQTYSTIDHLRLELVKFKKEKEDLEVQFLFLTLKDDSERFRMNAEREKQALIEDFQIKLAHKEILEGGYKEMDQRFHEFKKRIRVEVKLVRKHERELEHKLKILQSDTDLLIDAKDERILELSKKLEELYDQIGRLNDRIRKSEQTVVGQFDRQGRVLKALRLASSLLEEHDISEPEKKAS